MTDYSIRATMTPEQVAQRWGVCTQIVRSMLRSGTLKGFKCGTRGPKARWRILTTEVERFEAEGVANA